MTARKVDTGAVVTGVVLLTVGVCMLLVRYSDYEFGQFVRDWWPMILVLIGVPKLTSYPTLWNGLWLIALGSWMQLVNFNVFGMTWRNSWPLMLIVLGIGTIARAVFDVILHREESHEG
jgi:hypothetical protein